MGQSDESAKAWRELVAGKLLRRLRQVLMDREELVLLDEYHFVITRLGDRSVHIFSTEAPPDWTYVLAKILPRFRTYTFQVYGTVSHSTIGPRRGSRPDYYELDKGDLPAEAQRFLRSHTRKHQRCHFTVVMRKQ